MLSFTTLILQTELSGLKMKVPERAAAAVSRMPSWKLLNGKRPQPLAHVNPDFEHVIRDNVPFHVETLPLRDPDKFVPGQLHQHIDEWEKLLKSRGESSPPNNVIRAWLINGVDATTMFTHFKGQFKGKQFDSDEPPKMFFPNAENCRNHIPFIVSELEKRLSNGALTLLGKLGECPLPRLIMPLTVEPSKPRLCHDERFLNLWVKDNPFKLDTLQHLHRLIDKDARMISCDDKSGYDHAFLSENCKEYFGITFAGWVMVCNTLPFGWKASAFVYQSIGYVATSYLRSFQIRNTQYIDDRHAVETIDPKTNNPVLDITVIKYSLLQLLSRLGYTIAFHKSFLDACTSLRHLGFIVDSVLCAYLLPEDKKASFSSLRDWILGEKVITVKMLQRFVGKCISLALVVPGASLYTKEMNRAISSATLRSSNTVKMCSSLIQ